MGLRRGLRQVQLWEIQLDDLRVRAEAERVAVAFTRIERSADIDAAAGPHEPAATDTAADQEAIAGWGR